MRRRHEPDEGATNKTVPAYLDALDVLHQRCAKVDLDEKARQVEREGFQKKISELEAARQRYRVIEAVGERAKHTAHC